MGSLVPESSFKVSNCQAFFLRLPPALFSASIDQPRRFDHFLRTRLGVATGNPFWRVSQDGVHQLVRFASMLATLPRRSAPFCLQHPAEPMEADKAAAKWPLELYYFNKHVCLRGFPAYRSCRQSCLPCLFVSLLHLLSCSTTVLRAPLA